MSEITSLRDLSLSYCKSLGDGSNSCSEPDIKYCGETFVSAICDGTVGKYKITIQLKNGRVHTYCNCPVGGSCKHIRATAIKMHNHFKVYKKRMNSEELYRESLLNDTPAQLIEKIMEWRKKYFYALKSLDEDEENEVSSENEDKEDDDDEDDDDEDEEDEEDDDENEYEEEENEYYDCPSELMRIKVQKEDAEKYRYFKKRKLVY
ncbi:hypothetical protein DLAC_02276 [Tieghemostelium lacteum]|uniref:SWIM-type domain-containing protein n=1 Tax=Tieghemostelium lacteum TaxID=361077 RepID=A0A152A510_TIELA|nr:hypothetical protein DLAC_02276 [Tieghemostelium lacteum]|eukprot:KYR01167.1 hypothetical protein DLAC_02276 [Tieghemostelium lacteum]